MIVETPPDAPELDPGQALLAAVAAALPALEALAAHADVLGAEAAEALARALAEARARLAREGVQIVVVGEQKSGKSTFLNALLGERVLGTAARECTATVTRLRRGPERDYVATFEDGRRERFADTVPDRTPDFVAAIRRLEAIPLGNEPLAELPAADFLEPPLPGGAQEALVDAYRSLAWARGDLATARTTVEQTTGWWRFLARRHARAALLQAEARCAEATGGVLQAQRFSLERRIRALRQALAAEDDQRKTRFLAEVQALTDQAGRGQHVRELELRFPGKHLPDDLVLIDTPGINTGSSGLGERAWAEIREQADGCWLVSDIQQALSSSTRAFIQDLRPFVQHLFLVLTKVDRALANAGSDADAEEQVEEARKLAVRRFAKELGRAPREVLAVAVAAERALADDAEVHAAGFVAAVETLVALAQQERAIVLGARAAAAIQRASRALDQAGESARQAYEARIALLEAQRIPRPEDFLAEQMATVRPRLAAGMRPLLAEAALDARKRLARQQTVWMFELHKALDEDALKAEVTRIGGEEAAILTGMLEQALAPLRTGIGRLAGELEPTLFAALRERYRVLEALAGTPSQALVMMPELADPALALGQGLEEAVVGYNADRLQLGVGGAAAGAALGSLVMPGVGTLVGALVGSLAAFFVSLDDLKADCTRKLESRVREAEPRLVQAVEEAAAAQEDLLAGALAHGLAGELKRYNSWIEELLAAERAAIATTQAKLNDLQAHRGALEHHQAALAELLARAEEASRGLARSPDEALPAATVRLRRKSENRGPSS